MEEVFLKTPSLEGRITIGEGAAALRLPSLVKERKNFVVTDSNVFALYGEFLREYFGDGEVFVLPAGEENKNFQRLFEILKRMTEAGLHRTSRLFAVGGGVVGDIGGLAAALYMRGISCVQVPTTLLAQADSGVGGKTAVDLGGVKNVVGAFYQPCEVIVDPMFLSTLPPREIKCGLGELVKYAALDGGIFELLKANADKLSEREFLFSLILPSVKHKAKVVEEDEKETGGAEVPQRRAHDGARLRAGVGPFARGKRALGHAARDEARDEVRRLRAGVRRRADGIGAQGPRRAARRQNRFFARPFGRGKGAGG